MLGEGKGRKYGNGKYRELIYVFQNRGKRRRRRRAGDSISGGGKNNDGGVK